MITRKITSQSRISNDLVTTALDQINTARLFPPQDSFMILDLELFDGLAGGIYSRRPDHLSSCALYLLGH